MSGGLFSWFFLGSVAAAQVQICPPPKPLPIRERVDAVCVLYEHVERYKRARGGNHLNAIAAGLGAAGDSLGERPPNETETAILYERDAAYDRAAVEAYETIVHSQAFIAYMQFVGVGDRRTAFRMLLRDHRLLRRQLANGQYGLSAQAPVDTASAGRQRQAPETVDRIFIADAGMMLNWDNLDWGASGNVRGSVGLSVPRAEYHQIGGELSVHLIGPYRFYDSALQLAGVWEYDPRAGGGWLRTEAGVLFSDYPAISLGFGGVTPISRATTAGSTPFVSLLGELYAFQGGESPVVYGFTASIGGRWGFASRAAQ